MTRADEQPSSLGPQGFTLVVVGAEDAVVVEAVDGDDPALEEAPHAHVATEIAHTKMSLFRIGA